EQARGEADIDHRTDIYSMGAMVYEMLTGQVPYRDLLPAAVIMAQILEPPPSVLALRPDLLPAVDDLVRWGMAKDRTARPGSAGALAAALRGVE
ncbi:MAG: serine/threonine protein kinase, partial [Chloroflexi bacterium]|nr:serine/threonine protein kinase [Chloroflexota bacterium]